MRQFINCVFSLCSVLSFSQPGFLWNSTFGNHSTDQGRGIELDEDGFIYVTGFFRDSVDMDPGLNTLYLKGYGVDDGYVMKRTTAGSLIWAKRLGGIGPNQGNCQGHDIAVDKEKNVYSTGEFSGICDFDPGPGTFTLDAGNGFDIFISKLDSNGNFVWAVNFGSPQSTSNSEAGHSIAVDSNQNVYTIGHFQGYADFDPGPGTYSLFVGWGYVSTFVSKLDKNGNFIWARSLGENINVPGGTDEGYSVDVDENENVYITGAFRHGKDFDPGPGTYSLVSSGDFDIYIWKLDINGDFVWARHIGDSGVSCGNAVKVDKNGFVYVAGLFSGGPDFDPGAGVHQLLSNGAFDIFIAKFDKDGSFVWAKNIGGSENDVARDLAISVNDYIYTTGYFKNVADFDPGSSTYMLTSNGGEDIFISVLDGAGNFIGAAQMGGPFWDEGNSIALDNCTIYTTGFFFGQADFHPGAAVNNYSVVGHNDSFINCLSACILHAGVGDVQTDDEALFIYPNPNGGSFSARFNIEGQAEVWINIFNSRGQKVIAQSFVSDPGEFECSIRINEASRGIYFVEVFTGQQRMVRRVVVD